jgi:type IV secretory pathway TraG/TraD family ATPase VirD4
MWPHPRPVWTTALLVAALSSAIGTESIRYRVSWTPLQRWYASTYFRTAVMSALGFTIAGRYRLLEVDGPISRPALDEEVSPIDAGAELPFALRTPSNDRRLVWRDRTYFHAPLHAFLRRWIYADQSVVYLLRPAAWAGLAVFGIGALFAIPIDLRRARQRRHGRRLKGPELVTAAQFNRRFHADGVGFRQVRSVGRASPVRVPRDIESSHFVIMGDSGTGKSALIRQLLEQVAARGETAIVYDPALEYTGQFHTPARGDVILNPLDARGPYWSPGDEWRHEAETLTLAAALFPDRHDDNAFFTEGPRRLFAYLLTKRPAPEELAHWLCHDDEIDLQVKGTAFAAMIDRQAPAQRSGVLASLNMVADTLKLLPAERETTHRWSATAWSAARAGWLFLTSTPETRARLVPLTSLWLDLLVLRLMNQGRPHPRRTWFVLDELASLHRLPQLHTAITENRKSNNPVVIGFQGRSQLETRYGRDAEAMLSQPATKIFLRTSEPRAAKWIADTIGEIEVERLKESRSQGRGGQHSYGLERHVEPLVMASEISGLAALHGYLKLGNLVVPLSFPFVDLPRAQEAFVERGGPHSGPSSIAAMPNTTGTRSPSGGVFRGHERIQTADEGRGLSPG